MSFGRQAGYEEEEQARYSASGYKGQNSAKDAAYRKRFKHKSRSDVRREKREPVRRSPVRRRRRSRSRSRDRRRGRSDSRSPTPPPAEKGMIEVILNDRLGTKCRVKCLPTDTVKTLKMFAALQLGVKPEKLRLQKWYSVFKDHIMLQDYEIKDGMSLELHFN